MKEEAKGIRKLGYSNERGKEKININNIKRARPEREMSIATVVGAAIKTATVLLGIGIGKITVIPVLIAALAYFNYDLMDPENHPRVTKQLRKEYDFVLIGAGSAGSVLANRLTENPEWNVLLLEAGGHETEITDVPILSLYLHKSKLDWKYRTQPQDTACQAMVDRRCCWTRGKVGGCVCFILRHFHSRLNDTSGSWRIQRFKYDALYSRKST